jgi:hypothetical protein
MRVGPLGFTFQAHGFPVLQPAPEVSETSVVLSQTAGGRPGMPAPRLLGRGRPALIAPTVWTTLRLELHADGRAEGSMVGATTFPRHWVYDADGVVVSKSAMISFSDWYEKGPGTKATPWGDEDMPVFTTMGESALERELSTFLMQHGRPDVRELAEGAVLTQQGDEASELFVILDGIVARATAERPTLEATLQNALDVAVKLTRAELGSLFVLDNNNIVTHSILSRTEVTPLKQQELVGRVMDQGLAGWVFRHQEPALILETLGDDRWITFSDAPYIARSVLAVPILGGNTVLGTLTLQHSKPNHFVTEDLNLMQAAADQMALALRNARI